MQQALHPELNYNSCFRKKWVSNLFSQFQDENYINDSSFGIDMFCHAYVDAVEGDHTIEKHFNKEMV